VRDTAELNFPWDSSFFVDAKLAGIADPKEDEYNDKLEAPFGSYIPKGRWGMSPPNTNN